LRARQAQLTLTRHITKEADGSPSRGIGRAALAALFLDGLKYECLGIGMDEALAP
jgi:hypothetical protein